MAQVSQLWLEAEQMIYDFKVAFGKRFGVPITVTYKLSNSKGLPQITLEDLLDLTNHFFFETYGKLIKSKSFAKVDISNGIFSKTRVREVVQMRQIFCYIAHELGYGPTQIARFTGDLIDHSTAIHGRRTIKVLLEVKDPKITVLYKAVKLEMCNRFEIAKRIYEEDKERDTE